MGEGIAHPPRREAFCGGLAPRPAKTGGCAPKVGGAMSGALVFFSKDDCPLCEKGLAVVARLAERYGLEIEKVDIQTEPGLCDRYGERIPVLECGGEELGWGLLSERAIDRKLLKLLGK